MMTATYRNETRHSQTDVRLVDRVDPETDPYSIDKPLPDSTFVPRVNRRHVVMAGSEVLHASRDLAPALADARKRNRDLAGDLYAVEIVDLDETDAAGQYRWQTIRDWLAEHGDSLEGPPLMPRRPEDNPEVKQALAVTRQLEPDLRREAYPEIWWFVSRWQTTIAESDGSPVANHSREIVFASPSRVEAVRHAYRLNQAAGADSFFVLCVDLAIAGYADARGELEHTAERKFVMALRVRKTVT